MNQINKPLNAIEQINERCFEVASEIGKLSILGENVNREKLDFALEILKIINKNLD